MSSPSEQEYQSWIAELRSTLGVPLPACHSCKGSGEIPQDGILYVCKCGGSGVQMDDNEYYTGQADWKLHRCPDGAQCRTSHPGGCAGGWCGHFKVHTEQQYSNIFLKEI